MVERKKWSTVKNKEKNKNDGVLRPRPTSYAQMYVSKKPQMGRVESSTSLNLIRESLSRQEISLLRQSISEKENDHGGSDIFQKILMKLKALDKSKQQTILEFLDDLDQGKELIFRLLSTWGDDHSIGLTSIVCYDQNDDEVRIRKDMVTVRGGFGPAMNNIMNLFDSYTCTTKESHMWHAALPSLGKLEIVLSLPKETNISKVCIWNFNSNSIQKNDIGVKDLEILINNSTQWKGELLKGCGNTVFDICNTIHLIEIENKKVSESFNFPSTIPQVETSPKKTADDSFLFPSTDGADESQVGFDEVSLEGESQQNFQEFSFINNESVFEESFQDDFVNMSDSETDTPSSHVNIEFPDINEDSIPKPEVSTSPTHSLKNIERNPLFKALRQKNEDAGIWLEKKAEKTVAPERIHSTAQSPTSQEASKIMNRPKSHARRRLSVQAPEPTFDKSPEMKAIDNTLVHYKRKPKSRNQSRGPKRKVNDSYDSLMHFKMTNMSRLFGSKDMEGSKNPNNQSKPIVDETKNLNKQNHEALPKTIEKTSISEEPETEIFIEKKQIRQRPKKFVPNSQNFDLEFPEVKRTSSSKNITMVSSSTMPRGRELTINITSTHGDPHYVGLSGIEIFTDQGKLVEFEDVESSVTADPSDINVLDKYSSDPRVVSNLFNGNHITCDDLNFWLAPFYDGRNHSITIQFDDITTISAIRFWNYNKSRIHSFRGAKDIEVLIDGTKIYEGFIKKAPGTLSRIKDYAESVLFTKDKAVMKNLAEYDRNKYSSKSKNTDLSVSIERPKTGDKRNVTFDSSGRPMTSVQPPKPLKKEIQSERFEKEPVSDRVKTPKGWIETASLKIYILSSWGDSNYVGLTGIEVSDDRSHIIPLTSGMISANPRDMNTINGYQGDYRILENLLDGKNQTCDDRHMWLIPLTQVKEPSIELKFGKQCKISALRFYNYNKSSEDTGRGIKKIKIMSGSETILETTLRKAPGHANFDFGQTIYLSEIGSKNESGSHNNLLENAITEVYSRRQNPPVQDWFCPLLPSGSIFKFVLISSLGDPHYIGLNGIELYDALNRKIPILPSQIRAFPESIKYELKDCQFDQRVKENLISGMNNTWDDRHMFLSTFDANSRDHNQIFIIFDEPVAISCIKIWNYSKTPRRGAAEVEVYADDVLFWKTFLQPAPATGGQSTDFCQCGLFTNHPATIKSEFKHIASWKGIPQKVSFWNDAVRMDRSSRKSFHIPSENERPSTMMTKPTM